MAGMDVYLKEMKLTRKKRHTACNEIHVMEITAFFSIFHTTLAFSELGL